MSKEEKIKRILTTTGYTTEANKHEVLFYIEELERNNFKLQARADKYKCRNDKAIEYIEENIKFCENDSQGAYDVCNIRIRSDKKLLEILKGIE